jgi:aconitate hydratase
MLPFTVEKKPDIEPGDFIYIEGIREKLKKGDYRFKAVVPEKGEEFELSLEGMAPDERDIMLDGCLMNHYKKSK